MAGDQDRVERTEYRVLRPIMFRRQELAPGDTVLLRPDQAERLQRQGYVEPVRPEAPAPKEKGVRDARS